jgi:hypothetical protein
MGSREVPTINEVADQFRIRRGGAGKRLGNRTSAPEMQVAIRSFRICYRSYPRLPVKSNQ